MRGRPSPVQGDLAVHAGCRGKTQARGQVGAVVSTSFQMVIVATRAASTLSSTQGMQEAGGFGMAGGLGVASFRPDLPPTMVSAVV